jgi:signal transduction histidine kinase
VWASQAVRVGDVTDSKEEAVDPGDRSTPGPLLWTRSHPVATDRIATAVLVAVALAGMWLVTWSKTVHYRSPDAGGVLLILAITVPLAWRRQRPGMVLVLSGSALLAYDAAQYPSGLAWLATFWAVYSCACHRRTRYALWPLAVWVAEILAHLAFPSHGDVTLTVLVYLGVTAFVWVRGDAVRSGRIEAARERNDRARQAVADERTRIARELHDVVAHALGVIVMQAGGAGSVPALGEADAKAVLGNIERTGRQAFAEMRRLVGVLRDEDEGADLAPQPSVSEIPALVSRLGDAGLDVALEVEGQPRPASTGVELSAYRIVQEALTNTLKHAGAAHATVRVRWAADHLDVEVDDDGPAGGAATAGPVTSDSGGNGLVGMRERVLLFGGELEAGPRPEGGFRVVARLPLTGGA